MDWLWKRSLHGPDLPRSIFSDVLVGASENVGEVGQIDQIGADLYQLSLGNGRENILDGRPHRLFEI